MKKSIKFVISLFTAALLTLPSLTGCSNSSSTTGSEPASTASVSEKVDVKYDYVIVLKESESVGSEKRDEIKPALEKRLAAYGLTDSSITDNGDTFVVSYNKEGSENPDETAKKLKVKGYAVLRGGEAADGEAVIDSSDIESTEAVLDESTGIKQYVVNIALKDESKNKLEQGTEKYLNDHISLWIDGQLVVSPIVYDVIKDRTLILFNGSPFTEEEARTIAGNIVCVLPVELTVVSAEKTEKSE